MAEYAGSFEGQQISSMYPNVYRIRCKAYIGGRMYSIDKTMTAGHEYDARARAMRQYDIRRSSDGSFLEVEHVATLEPAS